MSLSWKTNIVLLTVFLWAAAGLAQDGGVKLTQSRSGGALGDITITVNGKPFTSFISRNKAMDIGKPVFWPVYSADGVTVTRGWPLGPSVPNERMDHPHHTGLFITHGEITAGDMEKLDFWGFRPHGERIRPVEIKTCQSGAEFGVLETVSYWEVPDLGPILEQTQKNTFRHGANTRIIDFDITLKAMSKPVTFADTKEGAIGFRVNPELQEENGTGEYLNAEGLTTDKNVWGKQSKWVALRGKVEGKPTIIAMMFHPKSHNSPPHWHARGYGCFAVNPFSGRAAYSNNTQPPSTTHLDPGKSMNLKYRVLIYSGTMTQAELEKQYAEYVRQANAAK